MNKAYKVVFNKLRGTMMVVNETTGFIQTKGAKTVIAAAAAAMLAGVSGAVIAADTVATVGENEHSTLKSALDSSSEGDTIVLVKDLSDQTGLSFGQTGASAEHAVKTTATKVTIDLNEHRYTVSKVPAAGSTGYESQGFHIEKATGSLAIKNGTIVFDSSDASSLRMGIQNYTDLTLDGVVVDATKLNGTYAMSNNHGNVVVKNSTIIAREGGVAFDVYYWPNNGYGDGVSVTVENSTVDGRIEVLSDGTVTNIGQTHNLIIDGGNLVANTYRLDGGKITTQGYTTISNVALSGNKARNGGAIYNFSDDTHAGELIVNNVVFDGNTATNGGAIYNNGGKVSVGSSSSFTNNVSTAQNYGGGAIYSVGGEVSIGDNVVFSGNALNQLDPNKTGRDDRSAGGAIAAWGSTNLTIGKGAQFLNNGYNSETGKAAWSSGGAIYLDTNGTTSAKMDIKQGSLFQGNVAGSLGGAIYAADSITNVTGSEFVENKAGSWGGALFIGEYFNIDSSNVTLTDVAFNRNEAGNYGGAVAIQGGLAEVVIENGTFKGNVVSNENGLGGAIYNDSMLTLKGKNHFEGNTVNGVLNDIYNAGTLNISGDLTLNGGIINAGTVDFTGETTVTAILTSDAIQNGSYALIANKDEGEIENFDKATLAANAVYDIAWDENTQGTIVVKTKSAEQIVQDLGIAQQQAGTVAAVLPILANSAAAPAQLAAIADAISIAAQTGNCQAVSQIAEDLAPSTAPVVSSVSQGVNNAIAGVANARLAANRAAGDVFTGGSAWAQVIYNSADQDATKKTAKLESDTYGVTVGLDGKIGDNLTIGAGFGVTKTDAESGTRDIDVDSYALFGYTEYNADNGWFVNGMVNAIRGRYEENKAPAGIKLTAKYQTTVLGAGVATGYHFENGLSPEVGLRYLRTHQSSYNDGAQKIHTDGTNLLTASIGAKYEKTFEQGDWVFKPNARVAATYDVVSDDTESAIRVIGGGQYHVISAHQKRAAYEAGIGLEASNGDWDFSVSYNGEFRSHFTSHTGMIKAKYNF